jgi:hypothetical protein
MNEKLVKLFNIDGLYVLLYPYMFPVLPRLNKDAYVKTPGKPDYE